MRRMRRGLLPDDEDRWRAYFDTDDELVFYCPECAKREFDNLGETHHMSTQAMNGSTGGW
jgi:hypothetical protein